MLNQKILRAFGADNGWVWFSCNRTNYLGKNKVLHPKWNVLHPTWKPTGSIFCTSLFVCGGSCVSHILGIYIWRRGIGHPALQLELASYFVCLPLKIFHSTFGSVRFQWARNVTCMDSVTQDPVVHVGLLPPPSQNGVLCVGVIALGKFSRSHRTQWQTASHQFRRTKDQFEERLRLKIWPLNLQRNTRARVPNTWLDELVPHACFGELGCRVLVKQKKNVSNLFALV